MVSDFLAGLDWLEPPDSMDFSLPYLALLTDMAARVRRLASGRKPGEGSDEADALAVYLGAPGIVNVMLNYRICVEHGLPLHPSVYYELKEARRYRMDHGLPEIERANRLYRKSIDLARRALRLDPAFPEACEAFAAGLPKGLDTFIYTAARDKYTWRGSEPALLERLAQSVRADWRPDIVVGAAHGSIMAGLLLAELLEKPLYFIRFSMFKRQDEEPIVTFSDESWLYDFRKGRALLYDEDVAGGRTLSLFAARLAGLFGETRSACSIRHAGASFHPDYTGRVWWD